MGTFEIKKAKKAGYVFNLKAGNNEIIATSEVYSTVSAAKTGIVSVMENAPKAPIEDQTVDGYTPEKNPKFEIYKDKRGEFRFRLKAKNGQIIAASEGYTTKANCKNGIESTKKNALGSKINVID